MLILQPISAYKFRNKSNPKSGVLAFDVRRSQNGEDAIFRARMSVAPNGNEFRMVELSHGNVKVQLV